MFFWNSLAFSMIQQMLAIWSLVPLPFLKPAWTSGSSLFRYSWSLSWRILSITLLACAAAASAAKLLHSCPTLWDPIDGSPPGSPVPGILQARTMECFAISFSNAWKWKVKVKSLSRVRPLVTPWTAAHQGSSTHGIFQARVLEWGAIALWDEYNCAVVWAFFGIAFLWDWNENWPFPVLWPLHIYMLNKQSDNIHPWHIPFPILNPLDVPCKFLLFLFDTLTGFLRDK